MEVPVAAVPEPPAGKGSHLATNDSESLTSRAYAHPADWSERERRWQALDPVFVRGMQRSGTSVTARALQRLGIVGFGEGHLWFEAFRPLDKVVDESYLPPLRSAPMAMGEGRSTQLLAELALAVDRFQRSHLDPALIRWLDKSPGLDPITVAPILATAFPSSQFIFLHRNPIEVVASGLRKWVMEPADEQQTFDRLCREWSSTMAAWRAVRTELGDRALELAQAEMAADPRAAAERICDFLSLPAGASAVHNVLAGTRALSSFPGRAVGSYGQPVDFSAARQSRLAELCGAEMERWGYELDFSHPSGPRLARPIDRPISSSTSRQARGS